MVGSWYLVALICMVCCGRLAHVYMRTHRLPLVGDLNHEDFGEDSPSVAVK